MGSPDTMPCCDVLPARIQAGPADPDIKARLESAVGGALRGSAPVEMRDLIGSKIAKRNALIDAAKIS
jgi:hypothetical protein